MSGSYYLTTTFDNCIPRRELSSCGVTRPFLSLRRVWLARLLKKSEGASLIFQVPGNEVRISGFIIFLGPLGKSGSSASPTTRLYHECYILKSQPVFFRACPTEVGKKPIAISSIKKSRLENNTSESLKSITVFTTVAIPIAMLIESE